MPLRARQRRKIVFPKANLALGAVPRRTESLITLALSHPISSRVSESWVDFDHELLFAVVCRGGPELHVYNQRKTITQQLKRTMTSNFVIVNGPDHPLLLRPPDLIIGGEGRLTAIMLATAEEARSPDQAKARYTLCRAALPQESVFVFVATDGRENIGQYLSSEVDEVLSWQDRTEVSKVAERKDPPKNERYSWKVKHEIMKRFGSAFRIAQHLRFVEDRQKSAGKFLSPDRTSTESRSTFRLRSVGDEFIVGDFYGVPDPGAIAKLTLFGASKFYDLTEGVPYPELRTVGSAYARAVPEAAGDPEKYLRASAFAGWVIVPSESNIEPEQVNQMVERKMFTR